MDDESKFLTRILFKPTELRVVEARGFLTDLLSPAYMEAFEEIDRFHQEHGAWPGVTDLQRKIGGIEIEKKCPSKPATVYWERIRRSRWNKELLTGLEMLAQKFDPESPLDDKLDLQEITETGNELFGQIAAKYSTVSGRPQLLSEVVDKLEENYVKTESGEEVGIPIPFVFLQSELLGWKPGRLIVVAGRPKTGKTWFAIICAAHAIQCGHRVVFVSLEMTIEELALRLTCVLKKISYNRAVKGKLEGKEKDLFFSTLHELGKAKGPGEFIELIGPGMARTPEAIASRARQHGANMVFVDAFYNMESEGEEEWQKVKGLVKRYRRITLTTNMPYMLVTQFNRNARGKKSSHLGNLAFSDAIGQDANALIYVSRSMPLKRARQMDLLLGEAREAEDQMAFRHNWCFRDMNWEPIGVVDRTKDEKNAGM